MIILSLWKGWREIGFWRNLMSEVLKDYLKKKAMRRTRTRRMVMKMVVVQRLVLVLLDMLPTLIERDLMILL